MFAIEHDHMKTGKCDFLNASLCQYYVANTLFCDIVYILYT